MVIARLLLVLFLSVVSMPLTILPHQESKTR
jgi:hypothetical protein